MRDTGPTEVAPAQNMCSGPDRRAPELTEEVTTSTASQPRAPFLAVVTHDGANPAVIQIEMESTTRFLDEYGRLWDRTTRRALFPGGQDMTLLLPGEPGHEAPVTKRRIMLHEREAADSLKAALDQSRSISDRITSAANAASLLGSVKSDQARLRRLGSEN